MTARVLLVDDDHLILRTLERALRPIADRVEVRTAPNAEAALSTIVAWRPDLVLSDCAMGAGASGFELAESLRSRGVRVALMTAGLIDDRRQALASSVGAVALLSKVDDLDDAPSMLLSLLERP